MATAAAALPASFSHLGDEDIIIRIKGGEIDAYEGIMRHHNQRLFRIARSIVTDDAEAMDVVQETFIVAFERLAELKEPAALPAWLGRIARNSALMRLRKSQRLEYMDEPDVENVLNMSNSVKRPQQPESVLANKQLRQLLEDFIDDLPDAFRTVFMLRAVEQCSVATTAEIMGIEPATVKTRYHRARLLLQDRVMQYSDAVGVAVHEFAGHRCDSIVRNVLDKLRAGA
ncbi:MAG TPA: RNA polymerase sigma factor [Woeseiaceae bacterium]|nr:RNA polymerase sigma factor [Woeseiaceae bacterium]